MRNLFIHTLKMNMAIFSNSFIYHLRALPLVKHIIPSTLYGNEGIGAFTSIIMSAIKIFMTFLTTTLYIVIVLVGLYMISADKLNHNFLLCMMILSFFGAFLNNKLLEATKEKYYSVVLMRIDGNRYAKMDFIKGMIINYITFTIILLISGLIMKLNLAVCLLLPVYIIACKIITSTIIARLYGHKSFDIVENKFFAFFVMCLMLIILGVALFYSIMIPLSIFAVITLVLLLYAVYCFNIFMKLNCFKAIYKQRLTMNNVIFNMSASISANTKKSLGEKIIYDKNYHSEKHGFEYFNEIFTQRHKKILTLSAYRFACVYLVIIATCILILLLVADSKQVINNVIMTRLPNYLFIMYFTNRGAIVTQAMFVNCDSSMLKYRFYRRPDVILGVFKQRLKTIISVNFIPSLVIAIGLCVLLYLSGGPKSFIYYVLIFLSINAMSAFFSVHYLVLYYVLQPYNINMQAKGILYSIISTLTYVVCYVLMDVKLETLPFTMTVIIFSIVYILISLAIAYKQAYKTFKIKN